MSALALAQLLALALVVFVVVSSLAASLAAPLVIAATRSWSASRRHRSLVVVGISPAVLTIALSAATLAPSALAVAWPAFDHCASHDDHHSHLCFVHPPLHLAHWGSWVVLIAALVGTLVCARRAVAAVARAAHLVRAIAANGAYDPTFDAIVVPTRDPLCLSFGALRPQVILSRGLIDQLSAAQLSVVTDHERAHVQRYDVLTRLIVRASTCLVLPKIRTALLHAIEASSEQACDEHAAQRHDRVFVAETILAMERTMTAMASSLAPIALSFTALPIEDRIVALLSAPSQRGHALFAPSFVLIVGTLLTGCQTIHHVTESLLELLMR